MIAGFTAEELLTEALVRPRRAFVPFPDIEDRTRPGWSQRITPSFRSGGLNGVELAQLDEHEVDAVIDATIAEYDAQGIRFRWTVGPDSRPHDLGARLERRGLHGKHVLLMAAATADIRTGEPAPDITVEPVDHANLTEYCDVVAAGWGVDPAPLRAYERFLLAYPDSPACSFLARRAGQPIGAANAMSFERSGYLVGAVVIPEGRGHGAYRALTAARLRRFAARGLPLVTSQALATTSAPLLERMGFVPVGSVTSYSR